MAGHCLKKIFYKIAQDKRNGDISGRTIHILYMTVFIRNAANLAHTQYTIHGLKNNFYLRGLYDVSKVRSPNQLKYLTGDFSNGPDSQAKPVSHMASNSPRNSNRKSPKLASAVSMTFLLEFKSLSSR
jgi:hypothetical protein